MTASIHNYANKLLAPDVFDDVMARLHHTTLGGPLSINLDLTVACNFACPHCIDRGLLNTGQLLPWDNLRDSLTHLAAAGLRSVILIGGGEPTLHPRFTDVIRHIKSLGLQCAIVTNGSRNHRIQSVASELTSGDWVRLSLDAGTDGTFQVAHRPRGRPLTLDSICESASRIKAANPKVSLGYSFVVMEANVHEIVPAATLARAHGFDYLSIKPMLVRDDEGAEVVDGRLASRPPWRESLGDQLRSAAALEDDQFRVIPSVNLAVMEPGGPAPQPLPRRCRMFLFRHVFTPMGVFGCPVYRDHPGARLAGPDGYRRPDELAQTMLAARRLSGEFDASLHCRNVTCLYRAVNRQLHDLAEGRGTRPEPSRQGGDLFL